MRVRFSYTNFIYSQLYYIPTHGRHDANRVHKRVSPGLVVPGLQLQVGDVAHLLSDFLYPGVVLVVLLLHRSVVQFHVTSQRSSSGFVALQPLAGVLVLGVSRTSVYSI